jgi:hypothetical protein
MKLKTNEPNELIEETKEIQNELSIDEQLDQLAEIIVDHLICELNDK